MAKYCTNCNLEIGIFEFSFTYDPNVFILCKSCYDRFREPIFTLKRSETPSELNEQLHKQKPILLEAGMTEEAFSRIQSYFQPDSVEDGPRSMESIILPEMIDAHLVTTSPSLENYLIKEYRGIVSGNTVLGTGPFSELSGILKDLIGEESAMLGNKMLEAKQAAMTKMIEQSIQLGGNAVIGVSFDYINIFNNLIGVGANGTSVTIEKRTEPATKDTIPVGRA